MSTTLYRSLPHLPSSPIGREHEIEAARRVLLSPEARLLTLTGPPGVGKTTLAIAVARSMQDRFPRGTCFVDLAPISEPDDVAPAIADRLDIRPGRGSVLMRLVAALAAGPLLLVLDNFEQVLDAAPLVADLLSACPRLHVLVTSRVPLLLRWEHELSIPPLALPDPARSGRADDLAAPAAALFVERARAANPYLQIDGPAAHLVTEICRRLDGLPLAIELAAARVRTDSLQEIERRLAAEERATDGRGPLDVLAGGPRDLPARQQTLRQAIGWSYALLRPAEQAVLRRLAVFVGGCTLDAAREIGEASSDILGALIEQSLLRREHADDGEPRVRLLEPIRQFALEQLAPDEREAGRRRHAEHVVALAELAEAGLQGADQPTWLRRLEHDRDNLRAALRWTAADGDAETAIRLAGALWRFWLVRGYVDEGVRSLDEALAHAERATPPTRARAFHAASKLAREQGAYDRAGELCRASLVLFRELDDCAGVALALNTLANVTGDLGDYDAAVRLYEESLALRRENGDRSGTGLALHNLAAIACARGDLAQAEAFDSESLALFLAAGDTWGLAIALSNQARTACLRDDLMHAEALARESLRSRRILGDRRGAILCLELLADVAARGGQVERAARLLGASDGLRALTHFVRPPDEEAARCCGPTSDARLETPELRAAWEAGRLLDLDAAIDEALSGVRDAPRSTAATPPVPSAPRNGDGPDSTTLPAPSLPPVALPPVALPPREREVAVLVARGLTNREIAHELVITEGTAANYIRRLISRLGVSNRGRVAAWAVERGLTRAVERPASA